MPSEPDHKIDELLKAYAKKRREDAAAPLEMHPATRKLLQAEVARRWPRTSAESSSLLQLLARFWPRFAIAAAGLVLIAVVIHMSNPGPKAGYREQMARAENKPVESFSDRGLARKDAPRPVSSDESLSASSSERVAKQQQDGAESLGRAKALARAPAGPANTPLFVQPREPAGDTRLMDSFGMSVATNAAPAANSLSRAQRDRSFYSVVPTNSIAETRRGLTPGAGISGPFIASTGSLAPDATKLALNAPVQKEGLSSINRRPLSEAELRLSDSLSQAGSEKMKLSYSVEERSITRKLEPSKPAPTAGPVTQNLDTLAKNVESLNEGQPQQPGRAAAVISQSGLTPQSSVADAIRRSAGERVHFSQLSEAVKTSGGKAEAASVLPPLSSFDLEQNGARIRIYDADGSVYEGQVVAGLDDSGRLGGASSGSEKKEPSPRASEIKLSTESARQSAEFDKVETVRPKTSFQASGTNRSLNQLVVINGTLISASDAETKAEASLEAVRARPSAPPEAPAPATAPASRFRAIAPSQSAASQTSARLMRDEQLRSNSAQVLNVRGRAKVGGTNELELNAIRAPRH